MIYGAAKVLVAKYVQCLWHRLAGKGIKVVLIKLVPTATPMTAQLRQQGDRLASVENVAQIIINGINKGIPDVYASAVWVLIKMIVRYLPRFVFNRIDL